NTSGMVNVPSPWLRGGGLNKYHGAPADAGFSAMAIDSPCPLYVLRGQCWLEAKNKNIGRPYMP
ncbi:MAG: hypothetical protein ACREYC_19190, partial [Gammaproteobacteria bacterium]